MSFVPGFVGERNDPEALSMFLLSRQGSNLQAEFHSSFVRSTMLETAPRRLQPPRHDTLSSWSLPALRSRPRYKVSLWEEGFESSLLELEQLDRWSGRD